MNSLFDYDEIDRIMDETKEAAEYQEEISSMLSGKLTSTDVAEVEQELEELLAVHAESSGAQLPEVPSHELPQPVPEERERERVKAKKERVALEA
ncbi:unnamed protein product [Caenorhabditis auriculariae]|uniref:Uncharacterized protein n=1 Tax=Caenorhabditis auriculariae TaxID=2777116 RepID=A0A8S1GU71_9PELO|nr:unnamed protein product [Caenorhabditis auriculariae]